MKRHNRICYAVLLALTFALPSCFLFKKNVSKNNTDSTSIQQQSQLDYQSLYETWKKSQYTLDTNGMMITFRPDTANKITVKDGAISVSGNIQDFKYSAKKEETKKDEGSKRTEYLNINTTNNITRAITIRETKVVERKPDYFGYLKIAAVLVLVAFVILKRLWFVKLWAKVISWLKGFFTGI
jgi:hypothetical protein